MASCFSLLTAAFLVLLTSTIHAQNCTIPHRNTTFTNCESLSSLNASIHWTYNNTQPNATLHVAFTAPPVQPNGWISWALNPTATGMIGAQSLIAFRDSNGSMVVKTYNISSYGPVIESPISYDVLNMSAEYTDGMMRIFATLVLPSSTGGQVNQVWQVGASVKNGVPQKHPFAPENLNAKNVLQLVKNGTRETASAPSMAVSPTGGQSGNVIGGSHKVSGKGFGLLLLLVVWISYF